MISVILLSLVKAQFFIDRFNITHPDTNVTDLQQQMNCINSSVLCIGNNSTDHLQEVITCGLQNAKYLMCSDDVPVPEILLHQHCYFKNGVYSANGACRHVVTKSQNTSFVLSDIDTNL